LWWIEGREVDHGDVIKPSYGYRFEYGDRVAVLSSDTRYADDELLLAQAFRFDPLVVAAGTIRGIDLRCSSIPTTSRSVHPSSRPCRSPSALQAITH
jgi:hypothetical protein